MWCWAREMASKAESGLGGGKERREESLQSESASASSVAPPGALSGADLTFAYNLGLENNNEITQQLLTAQVGKKGTLLCDLSNADGRLERLGSQAGLACERRCRRDGPERRSWLSSTASATRVPGCCASAARVSFEFPTRGKRMLTEGGRLRLRGVSAPATDARAGGADAGAGACASRADLCCLVRPASIVPSLKKLDAFDYKIYCAIELAGNAGVSRI